MDRHTWHGYVTADTPVKQRLAVEHTARQHVPWRPMPDERPRRLTADDLEKLCDAAVRASGGSPATARSLAHAVVAAERRGRSEVGAAHLLDYLDALGAGRLRGDASPLVSAPRGAVVVADADDGPAQLAFDAALDTVVARARDLGVALLSVHRCYSAGELGYYTSRVAEQGLVALAGSSSPALMSVHGARDAVTGTNPLSFALPHPSGPRMVDQASSATAWVSVRDAASRGEAIPPGWALDADGEPTVDAAAGLAGALLPFGGTKGGNVALMIEMLSALSGGAFSRDAPPFDSGRRPPGLGLFLVAVDPAATDPGYVDRTETHLCGLAADHGVDFGRRKPARPELEIAESVYRALVRAGGDDR